jgi:hypothetical protein
MQSAYEALFVLLYAGILYCDRSVSIAMGYRLDSQGSIPSRSKKFVLYFTPSRLALGLNQPPTQWVLGALDLGAKQLGLEADY